MAIESASFPMTESDNSSSLIPTSNWTVGVWNPPSKSLCPAVVFTSLFRRINVLYYDVSKSLKESQWTCEDDAIWPWASELSFRASVMPPGKWVWRRLPAQSRGDVTWIRNTTICHMGGQCQRKRKNRAKTRESLGVMPQAVDEIFSMWSDCLDFFFFLLSCIFSTK